MITLSVHWTCTGLGRMRGHGHDLLSYSALYRLCSLSLILCNTGPSSSPAIPSMCKILKLCPFGILSHTGTKHYRCHCNTSACLAYLCNERTPCARRLKLQVQIHDRLQRRQTNLTRRYSSRATSYYFKLLHEKK